MDIWLEQSSANTCQNQVKLCTLKVQEDGQLAMVTFCLSFCHCHSGGGGGGGGNNETVVWSAACPISDL